MIRVGDEFESTNEFLRVIKVKQYSSRIFKLWGSQIKIVRR